MYHIFQQRQENIMAMLKGLGCVITDPDCMTVGKPGIIEYFDTKARPHRNEPKHPGKQGKWYITFDGEWCGWYARSQFTLNGNK